MAYRITVFLLAALPLLVVPLVTDASTTTPINPTAQVSCPDRLPEQRRHPLTVSVCGPKRVTPGVNYKYTVVLTNLSDLTYRRVKLSVVHADPITRSSIPYRRVYNVRYLRNAALWTMKNFKPGRSYRVEVTLPFNKHNDPGGSNFVVDARAVGPAAHTDFTKDVFFK